MKNDLFYYPVKIENCEKNSENDRHVIETNSNIARQLIQIRFR